MNAFRIEGIVIKRKNYSEADRIITVFSKNHGKLNIKASGVRRITSRRSSHIELLNYCVFNLHQTRGYPILTEVESLEDFSDVKSDLKRIAFAYHVCELIDGLCAENQENFEIFMLLGQTLRKISRQGDLHKISRDFELNLLRLLGFYDIKSDPQFNTHGFIENILERKLKTKQMFAQLY